MRRHAARPRRGWLCESQKEPAEQAVASLEKSLENAATQAEKYLPDEVAAALRGKVAEMKALLEQQDYKAVVAQAPAVSAELRKLMADSAIAKANVQPARDPGLDRVRQDLPRPSPASTTASCATPRAAACRRA
jgi:hypothetical protein